MITFWLLVLATGALGTVADIALNKWTKVSTTAWWSWSALLFIVFMTCFGLIIKLAKTRGYGLTVPVLFVLAFDILGVAIWDVHVENSTFTPLQWTSLVLVTIAIIGFEIKSF